jgi:hypothetical protein
MRNWLITTYTLDKFADCGHRSGAVIEAAQNDARIDSARE